MKNKIAKRHKIPRMKILRRDNFICGYCFENQATTVDHIIPVAYKDIPDTDNLIACCPRCNAIAGSMIFSNIQEKRDYINKIIKKSPNRKNVNDSIAIHMSTDFNQENVDNLKNSKKEPILRKGGSYDLHIQTYTFPQVFKIVSDLYATKKSFRKIAKEDYKGRLSHAVIQRIAEGHEPKRTQIRQVLGLPLSKEIISIVGEIPNGTQALNAVRCSCGQWFITNHPKRTRCFVCSPFKGKSNR